MDIVDWSKHPANWNHVKGIQFPELGTRPILDILIDLDNMDLHCLFRDIQGHPGEPIARLTPLGGPALDV